jgi:hypothetical protein
MYQAISNFFLWIYLDSGLSLNFLLDRVRPNLFNSGIPLGNDLIIILNTWYNQALLSLDPHSGVYSWVHIYPWVFIYIFFKFNQCPMPLGKFQFNTLWLVIIF